MVSDAADAARAHSGKLEEGSARVKWRALPAMREEATAAPSAAGERGTAEAALLLEW